MCLYPTLIKNRKYTKTKKNGGAIPAPPIQLIRGQEYYDERVLIVPVGCGNCMECRKQKRREWQVRLLEDVRHNRNGKFVTLTFSNESIKKLGRAVQKIRIKEAGKRIKPIEGYDLDNAIAKLGLRRFLERWRKKYKKSIRHWVVTELGHKGTENIHMHGIMWTDEDSSEIKEIWQYGYTWIGDRKKNTGYVSERTINYITKYVTKRDLQHEYYKQLVLTTAGIGREYVNRLDAVKNRYKKGETEETYRTRTGHKMAMPIYWRNKIYTEEEREKLWIEKLDKNVRWVDGKEVDISTDDTKYFKLLYQARMKSKQLGYGDNTINWDKRRYENDRRNMLYKERIKDEKKKNHVPF